MEELLESDTPGIHDVGFEGMDIEKRKKIHGKSLEERGLFNVEKYHCWMTGATIKSLSIYQPRKKETFHEQVERILF